MMTEPEDRSEQDRAVALLLLLIRSRCVAVVGTLETLITENPEVARDQVIQSIGYVPKCPEDYARWRLAEDRYDGPRFRALV